MNSGFRIFILLALLLLPVVLGGCVGAFFSQPTNVEVTRAEVESVRREQAEILALVRELKTQMDAQSESTASMRADTNSQLRQLQERLEILQAQLEEQGVNFERLQSRPPERRPITPPPSDAYVIPGDDAAPDTALATLGGPPWKMPCPPAGKTSSMTPPTGTSPAATISWPSPGSRTFSSTIRTRISRTTRSTGSASRGLPWAISTGPSRTSSRCGTSIPTETRCPPPR